MHLEMRIEFAERLENIPTHQCVYNANLLNKYYVPTLFKFKICFISSVDEGQYLLSK